jgi:ubiquinone/menaquinone biosynthesis C-methylase UbiE
VSTLKERSGIDPFNADAGGGEGYVYTTADQFSSRYAVARHLELIVEVGKLEGRSVIDVGCGDGFYTVRFWDRVHPSRMAGVDPAPNAIMVADRKRAERPIEFRAFDAKRVPFEDSSFDVAILQNVLHHADDPQATIREALRVAREIVILEPNGMNAGLKVIEKVSPYHREHNERSYTRRRLRGWVENAGGRVADEKFALFVPMFSPEWLAKAMKAVEPVLEATPGLRALGCSVYVMRAKR